MIWFLLLVLYWIVAGFACLMKVTEDATGQEDAQTRMHLINMSFVLGGFMLPAMVLRKLLK